MAQEDHKEDKLILVEILVTIEKRLHFIVSEGTSPLSGKSPFRKEFIELLPGPWDEVAAHFKRSREMIEKDELNWQYVEGLGLGGKVLKWKKQMFDETVREGVIGRFLKVANILLESLSMAIPPLELVHEYKEFVEAALKYGRG